MDDPISETILNDTLINEVNNSYEFENVIK